jgi:hypothetical protein
MAFSILSHVVGSTIVEGICSQCTCASSHLKVQFSGKE